MKAIIPVAGSGSRLRPVTLDTPKAMVPVAGKPVLEYLLDQVTGMGIRDVVLVISPSGDAIRRFVDRRDDLEARYVVQHEPLGIGHAVHLCGDLVDDEPLLVLLGDVIYLSDFAFLAGAPRGNAVGVKRVSGDLRRYGLVETEGGRITRLVEKPDHPVSDLAIAGIYSFSSSRPLMEGLETLVGSGRRTRNEYQLTDALQWMVEQGEHLYPFEVDEWYDCGTPDRLLEANRRLLDLNGGRCDIPGSVIIPPVDIASDARVHRSVIGPHVAISSRASVARTIVRDATIGTHARIENCDLRGTIVTPHAVLADTVRRVPVGLGSLPGPVDPDSPDNSDSPDGSKNARCEVFV